MERGLWWCGRCLSALFFVVLGVDILLDLSDLDGGSGRLGLGRDRSRRTGEPVVD